ncbi:MAG TPA: SbmA/BacA-like family transporter [Polyangiaceae bacterium]|jgi:putative ATP-binding cassette transporter
MALFEPQAWSHIVAIGKPFLVSPMRWKVTGALTAIVTLLLMLNGLNVANSYVGRNFITSIADRNRPQYVHFAILYLCVFAASTLVTVMQQYVQDRLALSWRQWLTRRLMHHYLTGRTFEHVRAKAEIDNPDQRISQDVHTFTTTLLSFMVMLFNAFITTVAFAGILWSITPVLLATAVLYAAFGSVLTIRLGYRLVGLNHLQLKKEADMRYALIHAREHARSHEVPEGEQRRVYAELRRVVQNTKSIIGVTRNVGFFTSGYNYLVPVLPILLVAPRYFAGQIEFGVVTQSAMAFAQVLGAFSLIVVQFQSISSFAAVIRRLGELWDEMNRGSAGALGNGRKLARSGAR